MIEVITEYRVRTPQGSIVSEDGRFLADGDQTIKRVLAPGETGEFTLNLDPATVLLFAAATRRGSVTLKLNDATTPTATFEIEAGSALRWNSLDDVPNPIPSAVTKLFVTNNNVPDALGGVSDRNASEFLFYALVDRSPLLPG